VFKRITSQFKQYDPYQYWNKRKDPNNAQGVTRDFVDTHVNFIKKHTAGNNKIFELGPGVGRTFDVYDEGIEVKTLDLSKSYQDTLASEAEKRGINLEQHFLSKTDDSFPFSDSEFPVGVISQVLLHIPPEYILQTLSECLRISDKLVIITAYKHGEKTSNNTHCFNHDYFSIFSELGCSIDNLIAKNGQIFFTVRKLD